MQLLRNILALCPAANRRRTTSPTWWNCRSGLPERVNFTNLEHCGGWSVRTHARWFARDFSFAHLAVAALGRRTRSRSGNCGLWTPASCPRAGTGPGAPGLVLEQHGPRRAAGAGGFPTGGGAYPLYARQSPGETTVDASLALLREALNAGAEEILRVRWVAADGSYSTKTFVEGCGPWASTTAQGRLQTKLVLSFQHSLRSPLLGPSAGPVSGEGSPGALFPA